MLFLGLWQYEDAKFSEKKKCLRSHNAKTNSEERLGKKITANTSKKNQPPAMLARFTVPPAAKA
jgi:hypothetical protein